MNDSVYSLAISYNKYAFLNVIQMIKNDFWNDSMSNTHITFDIDVSNLSENSLRVIQVFEGLP